MSDDILVINSTLPHKDNVTNCYDDEAYKNARTFRYNEMDKAVNYVFNHIKLFFRNEIDYPKDVRFSTHYTLSQLNKIDADVESLEYEDYNELATYDDKSQDLAIDLIIVKGKFYFQISNTSDGEYENIAKIECTPNFNSELDLMYQMRDSLDKFIEDELEYSLSMQTNLKI